MIDEIAKAVVVPAECDEDLSARSAISESAFGEKAERIAVGPPEPLDLIENGRGLTNGLDANRGLAHDVDAAGRFQIARSTIRQPAVSDAGYTSPVYTTWTAIAEPPRGVVWLVDPLAQVG